MKYYAYISCMKIPRILWPYKLTRQQRIDCDNKLAIQLLALDSTFPDLDQSRSSEYCTTHHAPGMWAVILI